MATLFTMPAFGYKETGKFQISLQNNIEMWYSVMRLHLNESSLKTHKNKDFVFDLSANKNGTQLHMV